MRTAALGLFASALLVGLAACGQEGINQSSSSGNHSGAGGDTGGAGGGGGSTTTSGSGGGEAVPLALLNWNTHNFFNDKNDDATDGEYTVSATEYGQKRADVAAVLADLSPDIAVLQEIENQSVLDDLNASIKDAGGSLYPYNKLIPTQDWREIAILSRVPIDKVVSHQDEYFEVEGVIGGKSYRYTRDCLEAHLTVNGRELVILGVHFRSKFAPDDPDKRLAEAQHTCAIAKDVAKASPNAAIVILGDFNDTPDSLPVKAVVGCAGGTYADAALLEDKPAQWSFTFEGMQELIDHQVGNAIFSKMVDPASVVITHSAAVEDASDHSPVLAKYFIK